MKNQYINLIIKKIDYIYPSKFESITESITKQYGIEILDKIFNDPEIINLHEKYLYDLSNVHDYYGILNILMNHPDIEKYLEFICNINRQSNIEQKLERRYINIAAIKIFEKLLESENLNIEVYHKILEIFLSHIGSLGGFGGNLRYESNYKDIYDRTAKILIDNIDINKSLELIYNFHRQSSYQEKVRRKHTHILITEIFEKLLKSEEPINAENVYKTLEIFCYLNNIRSIIGFSYIHNRLNIFMSDEILLEKFFRKIGSIHLEKFLREPQNRDLLVTIFNRRLTKTLDLLINRHKLNIKTEYLEILIPELRFNIYFDNSLEGNFKIVKSILSNFELEKGINFLNRAYNVKDNRRGSRCEISRARKNQRKLIFTIVKNLDNKISHIQLVWLKLLISHGADPFEKNKHEKSVLDYMKENDKYITKISDNAENLIINCYIDIFFGNLSATSKNPFSGSLSITNFQPIKEEILSHLLPDKLPLDIKNIAIKKFHNKIRERN